MKFDVLFGFVSLRGRHQPRTIGVSSMTHQFKLECFDLPLFSLLCGWRGLTGEAGEIKVINKRLRSAFLVSLYKFFKIISSG